MSKSPDPLLLELAKLLARSAAARDISSSEIKVKCDENRSIRSIQQRTAK